jgi:hypothetical protein
VLKWEKRKKELKNEVFKTTIDDSYFLVYRGSPARGDSDSDAGKYLWSGAFIYCIDDGTGQIAAGA